MAAWTFTTPIIGVYSIIHNYPGIFKAISPLYIVRFFLRNQKQRVAAAWWYSFMHHRYMAQSPLQVYVFHMSMMIRILHNCCSCLRTGAEAMFADLGHFSKKAIQVIFIRKHSRDYYPVHDTVDN
jgi:KUP system potassium uptake protein